MIKVYNVILIISVSFVTNGLMAANLGKMAITDQGPCVLHQRLICYDDLVQTIRWEIDGYSNAQFITESDGFLILTFNHRVVALDTITAERLWEKQFTTDLEETLFEPVLDDGQLYLATNQGVLHKVSIGNGQTIWQVQVSEHWIYPPAIQDNVLITGGREHHLWGLNKISGRTIWKKQLPSELVYKPASLQNQQILVATYASDLHKLDARTGEQLWQRILPAPAVYLEAYNDNFLVGDYSGSASLHNTESGKTIWRQEVSHSPIYWFNNNDKLISFSNEQGRSTTLLLSNGHTIGLSETPNTLYSAPAFSDDELVFFAYENSGITEQPKPMRVPLAQ